MKNITNIIGRRKTLGTPVGQPFLVERIVSIHEQPVLGVPFPFATVGHLINRYASKSGLENKCNAFACSDKLHEYLMVQDPDSPSVLKRSASLTREIYAVQLYKVEEADLR